MIVKNEAQVICRCLTTVKPWIDQWIIVDTGSTDGTQTIIRDFMHDLPGQLHEKPWRDFAHNRNEALALAETHGDYLLFIDADEMLSVSQDFRWPVLDRDAYLFRCESVGWEYSRNALVSTRLRWRWVGVLHEFLESDQPHAWSRLSGPTIAVTHDGARGRSAETYLRDIDVLERAVETEPGNARYVFYLAQSYRDAGLLEQSVKRYLQRLDMSGWDEERWFSCFQIAVLRERLGFAPDQVREAYLAAYQMRPIRAEPLCELARYHRLRNEFALAHLYARQAAVLAYPSDSLFVDAAVYAWRALDELAVSAYYAGQPSAFEEGRAALRKLLGGSKFPASERERMEANRGFYGLDATQEL